MTWDPGHKPKFIETAADLFPEAVRSVTQLREVRPQFHFSIDDVFDSLIETTDRDIPLFEHPYFAMLLRLHKLHKVTVGLHLFYEKYIGDNLRNLSEVRDFRDELAEYGNWLFFGPHALNFDTPPYIQSPESQATAFEKIYREIDRFAGSERYCQWVRLHYYSESFELAEYFAKKGVTALFTTDRAALSHRMTPEVKQALDQDGVAVYQGMVFLRTHFRVEFFANDSVGKAEVKALMSEALEKHGLVVLYTHEYEFARREVCDSLAMVFDALDELGIGPVSRP
jgi:hypothetical protein